MRDSADDLEFEHAADIRDRVRGLRKEHDMDGRDGVEPEDEGVVSEPEEC